ncbi:transporter substrate-binding domain-containing protein [Simiduia sp. 21SJ11W-1]|uniref:substrate-binding periplasmic protein n=1 Tax=Simiduia sp. 21SJ11W-1 TaxID=2909669 RepID=UPI0020A026BB|nr:transporter substrate-binding domain-containing protein [Simiduia sp. 21SJ11W-1]UTA47536.1 transporter substrate-binding domain-containing protein [Simiduia sp. 21SJ11W-1]
MRAWCLCVLLLLARPLLGEGNIDVKEQPALAPLLVMYNANLGEPYIFRENGQAVAGIHWDLAHYLGRQLGREVQMLEVPRKRVRQYLEQGRAHLLLLTSPVWFDRPEDFQWTASIYTEQDLVIQNRHHVFPVREARDLAGKRVGMLQGYVYAELDDEPLRSSIVRDNAKSFRSNFIRLSRGRLDAIVVPRILADHLFRQEFNRAAFYIAPEWNIPHTLYSAVSPHSPVTAQAISSVYERMKQRGDFERILARYR